MEFPFAAFSQIQTNQKIVKRLPITASHSIQFAGILIRAIARAFISGSRCHVESKRGRMQAA
jgi:hypothetical protein